MSCRRSPAIVVVLTLGIVLGCSNEPVAPSGQTPPPPSPVSTVTVDAAQGSVLVGGTMQFSATVRDASGVTLPGYIVTWASSDNTVAAINVTGVVTGVGEGAATITATAEGKQGNASIAVAVGSLLIVAGDGQVGSLGLPLSDSLIVKVADPSGDGLPGVAVLWVENNSGLVSPGAVVTDSAGLARVWWRLGTTTGVQTATVQMATARALGAGSVTFTATTPSLVPLIDMGASTYFGFPGGLYPGGNNIPQAHAGAGRAFAASVQPLDTNGNPSPAGNYVFLAIGASNANLIWCFFDSPDPCPSYSFTGQALADPEVESTNLALVLGVCCGGAPSYQSPGQSDYNRIRDDKLVPLGLSEQQVQVVWLKTGGGDDSAFPRHDSVEVVQLGNVTRALRSRYPNLRLVFLSSGLYGGYAGRGGSGGRDPYGYEQGFSLKWLIEAQIDQMASGVVDGGAGDLNYDTVAPWIGWGPYFWADGVNLRSDGLFWPRGDFESDGIHLLPSGIDKSADLLLTLFKTSPQTRCWFLNTGVTC